MRADRLLQILALLRRHGRLPARRLAELLEVSERTVLRDMEALSARASRSTPSADATAAVRCWTAIAPRSAG